MKAMIIGTGGQGAPTAMVFSRIEQVSEIVIADIDEAVLSRLEKKINSEKVRTAVVDAGNIDEIAAAAEGVDMIVDLLTTEFTENVMRAALKADAHYINSAWDEWLLEGYDDHDVSLGAKPILYDEFKSRGKTALWGCGYSPGMATNVMARKYSDEFDVLESINIYLIKKNLAQKPELEALYPWNPGWSPGMAIDDQLYPKYRFEDGEFHKLTDVFAEAEVKEFPEPFGRMLVAAHCHEETYGMPHYFAAKGLKRLSFKYYIDKALGILLSTGLGSDEKVDINGAKVSPKEVLVAISKKPSDAFFSENPDTFAEKDENILMSIIVEMTGTKAGKRLGYRITSPKGSIEAPRQMMYDRYGTSIVGVALPMLVGCMMMVEGTEKGVIHPHELDPDRFFELLDSIGYHNKWTVEEI